METLYLFYKDGRNEPEFIKSFRSMQKLKVYIENDLTLMRSSYPSVKFSKNDYLIARRL